ncbi:tyrosine-type recombinase/integrase [Oenococcus oeni]|uniref:tyrosine-type recombinase/integrase n=3 Tax=Oenococcus oeni TaxID=1247 RepID=UPI000277B987|nr:tyrosine-type recombinase/integrase [Oenococcus oeni]EJO07991.1 phage integrase [Oenococcus oeni AWRIB422]
MPERRTDDLFFTRQILTIFQVAVIIIKVYNVCIVIMMYKGGTTMNNLIQQSQGTVPTVNVTPDLFTQFVAYIDASENTVKTYTRALKWMQANGVQQPQRADVLAYKEQLKEDHKATTVQNYIIALRQFFNWTEAQRLYPNIAKGIKGAKMSNDFKKDYLSARQAATVLADIPENSERGLRDYAIISLMLTGGLRTIEVSRANIEDMHTEGEATVLFLQGKGRDDRTEYVKIIPQVEDAIRAYLKVRGSVEDAAPLFASTSNNNEGGRMTTRSISGIAKSALRRAGFDSSRLTAHSLRHTAATLNLLNGGSLEETQQLLRHRNLNTTMVYLHHLKRAKNQSEARIGNAIFKQ